MVNMSQWLRDGKSDSGADGAAAGKPRSARGARKRSVEPSPRTSDAATPLDGGGGAGGVELAEVRPDPYAAQYIVSMVADLKKLAMKSGLRRVALILEMAELEARDRGQESG